jgi:hypothetical protein
MRAAHQGPAVGLRTLDATRADKSPRIVFLFEVSRLSWTFTPPIWGVNVHDPRLAGTPCPQLPGITGFITLRVPWVPRSFPCGALLAAG